MHRDPCLYPGTYTQTHPEVSLHHVGPKITAVSHPPGVASLAGGPKQLPPVPAIPALNPDEDYVIPIKDAPVTDYENKDGGWGAGGAERRGRGSRLTAHVAPGISVYAVLSPGWPEVQKPRQCPPAPRVQAKPHIAPKPGRGPSSPAPPACVEGHSQPLSAFSRAQGPSQRPCQEAGHWLSTGCLRHNRYGAGGGGPMWEACALHRRGACAVTQDPAL